MVTTIETSLREMKSTLHSWDSLNQDIDAELAQINSKSLEDLIRSRDQLRKLTQQEITDNTDNAEKMLFPLVGIAVVGGAVALYLGWQVSGLGILLEGGTPTVGATGAALLGVGKTALGLLKEKVAQHWYWRWAPVPLGMGFGVAKTVKTGWKMEKAMEAKAAPVPETVLKRVQENKASLNSGMEWVQEYNHDRELMEHLIPKLYNQVFSPEGGLLLTHHLLESFSLSESLSLEAKNVYVEILEREFNRTKKLFFGEWAFMLRKAGAKANSEKSYDVDGEKILGYKVQRSISDTMEEMRNEKESLIQMMTTHQKWVVGRSYVDQGHFEERVDMLNRGISSTWDELKKKLDNILFYEATAKKCFYGMVEDFQRKNPSLWQSFGEHAWDYWGSRGGMVGLYGSTLFLKMDWKIMFKGIPFMISGSWIEASYKAEEAAKSRLPVMLCIPSYGILCESL